MKRALAALAILALTACGTSTTTPAQTAAPADVNSPAESVAPSSTAPKTSAPSLNAHGNLPKKIGEVAGIRDSSGNDVVQYVVKSITPNFKCTAAYAQPSEHGQYVAIMLDITTASADIFQAAHAIDPTMITWKVYDPDGTTENEARSGSSYACLNSDEGLPMTVGAGEHVTGTVVLDVKSVDGSVAFFYPLSPAGFEYSFKS